jgi:Aromatic-ring-opening dioxygenase LigAB, LigA subunit
MASNFTNFVISLSNDPLKLADFNRDPQAVVDAAGLTPAEKTLLLNRDMQGIRSALVADPGLRAALNISTNQSLPPILPAFIRIV